MSYVMVDVESEGPIPGGYSMISFGAVLVTPALDQTFYGVLRLISDKWIPEALAVSGFSRENVMQFDPPEKVMADFREQSFSFYLAKTRWCAVQGSNL